jgi:L-aspartate oxidase
MLKESIFSSVSAFKGASFSKSLAAINSVSTFDVLIVGGGAAGLYAALCLPSHLQVGLVTKDNLSVSASDWAQGGIAAAIAPDDSPNLHLQDTLRAGAGLCDPDAVNFLVVHAPDCIHELVELGVAFDRTLGGELALTLEAAHSQRRVLHAADTTGHALMTTLTHRVLQRANVQIIADAFVLDVWLHPQQGHCQGVKLVQDDRINWIRANAVLLATGGGGQVYAQTTNPSGSTGDGVAIAWRAGAEVRDLEFVQFHPTALTKSGAPHFLISEAVRGEGAHLIDAHGHRFAFDYHPKGELAPRDIVSRAIYSHLQTMRQDDPTTPNSVWLDLRPIPVETILHRFPNILGVCQRWGIDPLHNPIPVTPAAHYWMGGVTTDLMNQTSIPGLYALGETASTGVHGANRLASNSLLECIVFGRQMLNLALKELADPTDILLQPIPSTIQFKDEQDWTSQLAILNKIRQDLPNLMWDQAGICRQEADLERAIVQVNAWQAEFLQLPLSQSLRCLQPGISVQLMWAATATDRSTSDEAEITLPYASSALRTWGETHNLLDIANLILKSALFRTESRGGHYRTDYPKSLPEWQVHTLIKGDQIIQSL